ncbi:hypothetical protein M1555_05055 [Patescibacteria group bacterium]|nr:hypothetical protein [Patescibacteria group bacterium]
MFEQLEALRQRLRKLPERKSALDFLVAALTIPVLLTVITANLINISNSRKAADRASAPPVPTPIQVEITGGPSNQATPGGNSSPAVPAVTPPVTGTLPATPTPTPVACNENPQPYTIIFPAEGQTVSDVSPVCIALQTIGTGYCTTTLSYSVNGGSFSQEQSQDKSLCLGSLADGPVTFQLKAKSTVSGVTQLYTLHFTYQLTTPTPTPVSSGSATTH